ncbi:related to Mevalonate kinase [Saccharomycodes ludwigii]|uniref:Mevalonate kinase n=1 Tax=Saccharomycodes ludwigii TaxID=36035 RepID=A0A376B0Z2_9ASCO|nr:hypothetical protein SCDLUD_002204 [Saccharomycodes ludwigii]KAH3902384.1 hypothetical protein SCDLUD_002204 [Saccharomycodes ludwigii]SSD58323.1 related to Mevalonate kinase [Saccharomycodes ludwigii]
MQNIIEPFITSAPGKVIIFGEHSAVYGEPVIAAAVSSLRSYLLVTQASSPNVIELDFPDIKFDHKWSYTQDFFPSSATSTNGFDLEKCRKIFVKHNQGTTDLDLELEDELTQYIDTIIKNTLTEEKKQFHYYAALCFLYLYFNLCPQVSGVKFTIKSNLPVGAGLGSSASISVCLTLAMCKLGGILSGMSLSEKDKKMINKWSYIGEKCTHGTPSGIDNAVATFGGAVLFQKQVDGKNKLEVIENFPQIPMILTNTKIPKSTKKLISDVRKLCEENPKIMKGILSSMGYIAETGASILKKFDAQTSLPQLIELVRINHGLLVSIGVSHPGLEKIKLLSDTLKIGGTKLTGAGGGGCALTILLDHEEDRLKIEEFKNTLHERYGYDNFDTDLGGTGSCFIDLSKKNGGEILNAFTENSAGDQIFTPELLQLLQLNTIL